MILSMKKLREARKCLERKKDEDGFIHIHVDVGEGHELFNPFAMNPSYILNPDIYDYIEGRSEMIPHDVPLEIVLHGRRFDETEQEQIRRSMKRHYEIQSYNTALDRVLNFRKMMFMSAFGIGMLLIYFYMALFKEGGLLLELFSIFGSFSLWEAASSFLVQIPKFRMKEKEIKQYVNMKVSFCE